MSALPLVESLMAKLQKGASMSTVAPAPIASAPAPAVSSSTTSSSSSSSASSSSTSSSSSSAPAAPPPPLSLATLADLDLVVGFIQSAEKHSNANALYVEQIDVGAARGGVRQIVSGLAKFLPLEEVQGQRVIVVANLLPIMLRKPAMSYGMLLCAKSADGKVAFVAPPAAAKVGDRVTPIGLSELQKAEFLAVKPSKDIDARNPESTWAKVAPHLRTDATGEVVADGFRLGVDETPLTSTPNSPVS